MAIFQPIFTALNQSGGRYVVVGGLAVVLHGYARLTGDIDLIVDFEEKALTNLIDSLTALGLRPRPPVEARELAKPERRAEWVRDKGMRVFSFWDPANPLREVDLFVEHPTDFEGLWARAVEMDIGGAIARIASIPDLIRLKQLAGRPQDLQDVEALEAISKGRDAKR